jgi:hypothetical protein
MQTLKFQSLDSSYAGRNISGKKVGKELNNNYALKLHRMFDCLDIILNSYHCYLDAKPEEEDGEGRARGRVVNNRFYYFVGSGNNSNLIRSILRKRSWWSESASLAKANLVWTQLKLPEVMQRMQPYRDSWDADYMPFE